MPSITKKMMNRLVVRRPADNMQMKMTGKVTQDVIVRSDLSIGTTDIPDYVVMFNNKLT